MLGSNFSFPLYCETFIEFQFGLTGETDNMSHFGNFLNLSFIHLHVRSFTSELHIDLFSLRLLSNGFWHDRRYLTESDEAR